MPTKRKSKVESSEIPMDELFIGIVKAIGTELKYIDNELRDLLHLAGYQVVEINLAKYLPELEPKSIKKKSYEYFNQKMNGGNTLRETFGGDFLALRGVEEIAQTRDGIFASTHSKGERLRYAYLIDDIVHPEEVHTLRAIYGPHLFLVSVYQDENIRRKNLLEKLQGNGNRADEKLKGLVNELMRRDRGAMAESHHISIDKTFHLGDVFIDVGNPKRRKHAKHEGEKEALAANEPKVGLSTSTLRRMFEQIFSGTRHEPSKHEVAMSYAHTAALRSGSLARRVGAAIVTPDGTVLATGYNEVAAPGGGQYPVQRNDGVELDARDGQYTPHLENFELDEKYGYDSNDLIKYQIFEDLIAKLKKIKQIPETVEAWDLIDADTSGPEGRILRSADLFDVVEYSRTVHAEMSALMSALRHGVSVRGCYLYTTTFPCHECARHIVAAGIDRVVYQEPYPKSRVKALHEDSIVLGQRKHNKRKRDRREVEFIPFIGISLSRQRELFSAVKRKHNFGDVFPPGQAMAAIDSTAITPHATLRWESVHDYMHTLLYKQREIAEGLALKSLDEMVERESDQSA